MARYSTWRLAGRSSALFALLLSGCEDSSCVPSPTNPCPSENGPELVYAQTSYETAFFVPGNTVAPSVSWAGGPVGTLSLGAPPAGVTVDPSTGVVSWDRSLPLGINHIQVRATNSLGTSVATLQIENYFEASFTGGFNEDPTSQDLPLGMLMGFNRDGSMTVVIDDGNCAGQQCDGNGTWSINASTVTARYVFPHVGADGSDPFRADGTLTYSTAEARLEGTWFNEKGPDQDGLFRLTIN